MVWEQLAAQAPGRDAVWHLVREPPLRNIPASNSDASAMLKLQLGNLPKVVVNAMQKMAT
jgi:hypothetical protein